MGKPEKSHSNLCYETQTSSQEEHLQRWRAAHRGALRKSRERYEEERSAAFSVKAGSIGSKLGDWG